MLVALFGVLALGALTAAAAQAVEAPRWSITGTDLAAGKTHYISTKIYSNAFTLTGGTVVESCTEVKLVEGSLLGSNAGNPGKNNEVIEFTKCSISGKQGGKTIEKCKVVEPIRTKPVVSELVETTGAKPEEKKGSLLALFAPAEGATFVTLEFTTETGGFCPVNSKVSGEVIGEVRTDPNTPPTLGTLVSLESGATEAESWLINFPTTPILKVTLFTGNGEFKEVTDTQLNAFSENAVLEGTALILLAKKNTTTGLLETEKTKWSPLP